MSKLMSLEDNIVDAGSGETSLGMMLPPLPGARATGGGGITAARPVAGPVVSAQEHQAPFASRAMVLTPAYACGGCGRCSSCRQQESTRSSQQAPPAPINITITNTNTPTLEASPTFTASPQHTANPQFEANPQHSANPQLTANPQQTASPQIDAAPSYEHQGQALAPAAAQQHSSQAMPATERIIERPVFIDRLVETIKEIARPVLVPVERLVKEIIDRPVPMPVKYEVPVDRSVPVPVRRDVPVDRQVPVPVQRDVPVDRQVPVPVRRDVPVDRPIAVAVKGAEPKAARPAQPFATLTNKRDSATDINWWT